MSFRMSCHEMFAAGLPQYCTVYRSADSGSAERVFYPNHLP